MAVHLELRRPVPPPAAQLRLVWQGMRPGDAAEAHWSDAAGRAQRWAGARGVSWLQRDQFAAGEEWKINLPGIPADVPAIVFSVTVRAAGPVGVAVRPLAGDPDQAVLHPGAAAVAGHPTTLLRLDRHSDGWTVTAVSDTSTTAPVTPTTDLPTTDLPTVAATPPVTPTAAPPSVTVAAPPPPAVAPPATPAAPEPRVGPTEPWPTTPSPAPSTVGTWGIDDGPRIAVPERLTEAADAARATGKVRRAPVHAIVDLSASMYPWLASGAVADVLTAIQGVTAAAQRPAVSARLVPAETDVEIALDAEPAAVLADRLRAGLATGNRDRLLHSLPGPDDDRVTVLITDDPSLAGPTTTVLLGAEPRSALAANAIAVGSEPIDVNRLAHAVAERCFTTPRR